MSKKEELSAEETMAVVQEYWMETLGLDIGENVVILPRDGQGFEGILVDFVSTNTGMPMLVIIQQAVGMPRVTIRWDAITMITSKIPEAPIDKTNTSIDFESLVAFAEREGIDVPDSIKDMIDSPSDL